MRHWQRNEFIKRPTVQSIRLSLGGGLLLQGGVVGDSTPWETQSGWKNGDISLAGGWFAVLFDGEEESKNYHGMMVIGHIEEESLDLVKALPAQVKFTVELANEA